VSAQKSLNYEKLILAKNTFSPCGRLAMSLPVLLLAVACWPGQLGFGNPFSAIGPLTGFGVCAQ